MTKASAWVSRHKLILIAAFLPILVALWWAFRPEKLWINQAVNEPAPFDTGATSDPLSTGQFDGSSGGRVTVFKKPDGSKYLRLSDVTVPPEAEAHVELAKSSELSQAQNQAKMLLDTVDLGAYNQGSQNYDLPSAVDLAKYDAVVISNKRLGAVVVSAKLQPF